VTYRDRIKRETLAKLSQTARALYDDRGRWLAAEDEERPPDPRRPVPALTPTRRSCATRGRARELF
jgi:hypothetical protein